MGYSFTEHSVKCAGIENKNRSLTHFFKTSCKSTFNKPGHVKRQVQSCSRGSRSRWGRRGTGGCSRGRRDTGGRRAAAGRAAGTQ